MVLFLQITLASCCVTEEEVEKVTSIDTTDDPECNGLIKVFPELSPQTLVNFLDVIRGKEEAQAEKIANIHNNRKRDVREANIDEVAAELEKSTWQVNSKPLYWIAWIFFLMLYAVFHIGERRVLDSSVGWIMSPLMEFAALICFGVATVILVVYIHKPKRRDCDIYRDAKSIVYADIIEGMNEEKVLEEELEELRFWERIAENELASRGAVVKGGANNEKGDA